MSIECVKIGTATLYNCDCMEAMAAMPDNAFDLAIVDPPYGIGWMEQTKIVNTGKNWIQYDNKAWDAKPPSLAYFKELRRVSKNQIIWGANYFKDNPPSPCWVIWDKMQEFSGATFEMAWTSFKSPAKAFRMARCTAYVGTDKIHHTQKPVRLYQWLLSNYAKSGNTILDTHHGSGSNAIACLDMGYSITAYEIDAEYFKASVERIQRSQQQCKLFDTGATWRQAEKVKGELTGSFFAD